MERRWSLETARELLPEVRRRTARAVAEADRLDAARKAEPPGSEARSGIEAQLEAGISRWVREMDALGVEVKGPWLVDFDSGAGYYCWQWPEEGLDHFHGYEEGFTGRVRIQ